MFCVLYASYRVRIRVVYHPNDLDDVGLGLLQLFFIIVGPFIERWGGISAAFDFHPRNKLDILL